PYRYAYGASSQGDGGFIDSLVKLDIETGAASVWQARGCYPGEPVFVAAPQAETEDQGGILSVLLDAAANTSFLLVLDAHNFTELARAVLPHHLPFGFHGNFFPQPDVYESWAPNSRGQRRWPLLRFEAAKGSWTSSARSA